MTNLITSVSNIDASMVRFGSEEILIPCVLQGPTECKLYRAFAA